MAFGKKASLRGAVKDCDLLHCSGVKINGKINVYMLCEWPLSNVRVCKIFSRRWQCKALNCADKWLCFSGKHALLNFGLQCITVGKGQALHLPGGVCNVLSTFRIFYIHRPTFQWIIKRSQTLLIYLLLIRYSFFKQERLMVQKKKMKGRGWSQLGWNI